jgi:hypothetical protein
LRDEARFFRFDSTGFEINQSIVDFVRLRLAAKLDMIPAFFAIGV